MSREVFSRLQSEPDIAYWLWPSSLPEAVPSFPVQPGFGLHHLLVNLANCTSHFQVQGDISAFLDSVLRHAPPSHALYAVAWKCRRLVTELFRSLVAKIPNDAYFEIPLPHDDEQDHDDLPTTKATAAAPAAPVKAATTPSAPAPNGGALLARLSALEAQIAGLHRSSGGGGGGGPSKRLSVAELARLETDIGNLPDAVLERMVSEKLRNTTGLRWEGVGADRVAVVEVGNLDPKNQRALRKWVTQQLAKLKPPSTGGAGAGGASEEVARQHEARVERLLEARRAAKQEDSAELARLRELERQAEEAKRYIDMMAMDNEDDDLAGGDFD